MKAGWKEVGLSEVVTLNYGKSLAQDERNPDGLIPVYGANGVMDWSDRHLTTGPSLVVGRKGSAGEITRVDGPFWPSDVTYFTTHDKSKMDFDFLHYAMRTLNLQSMARGVKPGINRNDVYGLTIPLPPLEEQQQIVAVLDEAFEGLASARAHAEANLRDARELFENSRSQVFSRLPADTPTFTLGELCSRVSVGHVGETSKHYTESDGIPFVRSQNVRPIGLDLADVKQITTAFHATLKKSQLKGGELLFVRVGANRGDCCAMPVGLGEMNCANIVFARPKTGVLRYLEQFCQSNVGRAQLIGMTTGSAQGVINTRSVATLPIPFPSAQEQEAIAATLDELEANTRTLQEIYLEKIERTDALRQSLLQKAFAGELT